MKAIVMKYLNYIPYPGAASRREQMHDFLDKCLLAASAVGIVAALAIGKSPFSIIYACYRDTKPPDP